MKLEVIEGYTRTILKIDDKKFSEYSDREQKAIYNIFVDKILDIKNSELIISELVKVFGLYESDESNTLILEL